MRSIQYFYFLENVFWILSFTIYDIILGRNMLNNNYTIEELRRILFHRIEKLIKIEPYWNKCMHCQHHGKCCIKANVSIREDEWIVIKEYIQNLNESDKSDLRYNIEHNIFCPFRASDKCLIHEVRPLNCIWTPFQVVQNIQTNNITYYMSNNSCDFSKNMIKNFNKITDEFVFLESYNTKIYYLFINDIYIEFIKNPNQPVNKLSKLINQVKTLI